MKKEYKKKYNLTFTPSVYEKFQSMLGENGLMVSPVLEMQMRVMLNAKKGVFKLFDGIFEAGKAEAEKELTKNAKGKKKK